MPMKKSKRGSKQGTSESLSDSMRTQVLKEELNKFTKLVKGHRKLLEAIGKL